MLRDLVSLARSPLESFFFHSVKCKLVSILRDAGDALFLSRPQPLKKQLQKQNKCGLEAQFQVEGDGADELDHEKKKKFLDHISRFFMRCYYAIDMFTSLARIPMAHEPNSISFIFSSQRAQHK